VGLLRWLGLLIIAPAVVFGFDTKKFWEAMGKKGSDGGEGGYDDRDVGFDCGPVSW
jgi:hypothetical protein